MTVSYALTDRTVALFADRELFADEARLEPLARIEPPPSRELFYGGSPFVRSGEQRVVPAARPHARGNVRGGAYPTAAGEGAPARSARITGNTVAYLQWSVPVCDGIALS
ncbi:MAG: hypothetical protein ACLSVD_00795 [Eggerthellaceae bacterium]